MKHAGASALDRLEPLLDSLRRLEDLKEKSRGVFYRRGRAFLHFHEHGEMVFADVRLGADFERFPATTAAEKKALLERIRRAMADGSAANRR